MRNTFEKLKSMNMGFDPVWQCLGCSGLGKGIIARTKDSDKYLGICYFACFRIIYGNCLPCIVNKQLFSGIMPLP